MFLEQASRRSLIISLGAACLLTLAFAGCGEEELPSSSESDAGSGGQGSGAGDGNEPGGAGGNEASGGERSSNTGSGGSGAEDGAGGSDSFTSGGNGGSATETPEGGAGGVGESGGEGGADGFENLAHYCAYDEDVGAGGGDGAGGAGSDAPDVGVVTHPVLGPILVDAAGVTLYTVGRDTPGDCDYAPTSDCTTAACLTAWPVFYAGDWTLGAGLDEGVFGTYLRPDGQLQTTYYGWPLYYYQNDTAPGLIGGQGKQGLWHAAEVTPALIVTMRAPGTTTNYIAAANGRSLYVHTLDAPGNGGDEPESACTDKCLKDHPPFLLHTISVVSSLEPTDFTLFERSDGQGLQVAYQGAPLYFDRGTKKPGEVADPMPENWGLAFK
jgi:predicted lipoprotein with Yx(FWY)xxD motif